MAARVFRFTALLAGFTLEQLLQAIRDGVADQGLTFSQMYREGEGAVFVTGARPVAEKIRAATIDGKIKVGETAVALEEKVSESGPKFEKGAHRQEPAAPIVIKPGRLPPPATIGKRALPPPLKTAAALLTFLVSRIPSAVYAGIGKGPSPWTASRLERLYKLLEMPGAAEVAVILGIVAQRLCIGRLNAVVAYRGETSAVEDFLATTRRNLEGLRNFKDWAATAPPTGEQVGWLSESIPQLFDWVGRPNTDKVFGERDPATLKTEWSKETKAIEITVLLAEVALEAEEAEFCEILRRKQGAVKAATNFVREAREQIAEFLNELKAARSGHISDRKPKPQGGLGTLGDKFGPALAAAAPPAPVQTSPATPLRPNDDSVGQAAGTTTPSSAAKTESKEGDATVH